MQALLLILFSCTIIISAGVCLLQLWTKMISAGTHFNLQTLAATAGGGFGLWNFTIQTHFKENIL
jgi:hypothetical protein